MTTGLFWLRPAGGGRSLRCGVLVLLWAAACTGPRVNPSFEASWSATARENVARAVTEILEGRGFAVVRPKPTVENAALQDDLLGRYRLLDPDLTQAWLWMSYRFTPGPFEFSLGPVEAALAAWNSDMLVFASGSDEISDALRSVQQALRTDSTWGKATLRIALVKRSGTVVWFCGSTAAGGDIDLRSAAGAMTLAGRVFADLPPR